MTNKIAWTLVILVVAVLVIEVAIRLLRRNGQKNMMELLARGDYDGFDAYCGKGIARLAASPYTAKMMKLNALLRTRDEGRIQATFEELEGMDLNDRARCELALQGFYHYMPRGDKKKCRKYVEIVQATCPDEATKELVTRFHEVKVEKKDDLLPTLLQELEGMEEMMRFNNEHLISEIYRNQKNEKEAKRYAKLSQTHREQYLKALGTEAPDESGN